MGARGGKQPVGPAEDSEAACPCSVQLAPESQWCQGLLWWVSTRYSQPRAGRVCPSGWGQGGGPGDWQWDGWELSMALRAPGPIRLGGRKMLRPPHSPLLCPSLHWTGLRGPEA